jgi:hypothetical protein
MKDQPPPHTSCLQLNAITLKQMTKLVGGLKNHNNCPVPMTWFTCTKDECNSPCEVVSGLTCSQPSPYSQGPLRSHNATQAATACG